MATVSQAPHRCRLSILVAFVRLHGIAGARPARQQEETVIAFTWGVPDNAELPEGSSTVEIYLTADGDDTIADLTHRDLPIGQRAPHKHGWEMRLTKLTESAHH